MMSGILGDDLAQCELRRGPDQRESETALLREQVVVADRNQRNDPSAGLAGLGRKRFRHPRPSRVHVQHEEWSEHVVVEPPEIRDAQRLLIEGRAVPVGRVAGGSQSRARICRTTVP